MIADDSDGGNDHGPDSNVAINKDINVYEGHGFSSDNQEMGLNLSDFTFGMKFPCRV